MTESVHPDQPVRAYAWLVFALTFGLLISDYMARQVLNAVFPLLKAEWSLSDSQLGLLSGVVAIMVGLLSFPLSLAADRWGRVKSLTAMAVLWSLATLLCGLAGNYPQMLAGRLLVGVGEAAYGSVGLAVLVCVFPQKYRGTLSAAFLAGSLLGQVLGVGIGGAVAEAHGWRLAFVAIGLGGLALGLIYPLVVREARVSTDRHDSVGQPQKDLPPLATLFRGPTIKCAYVAGGLQLFVAGALPAWLPTYLSRYYQLPLSAAASLAALFLAICGAGMVAGGALSDRWAPEPWQKMQMAAGYSIGCACLLAAALFVPFGMVQLVLLGAAMFLAASTAGPASATIANLVPPAIHGTAFATLALGNNLLGLAPGPIITGWLADRIGLLDALKFVPLASVGAALVFSMAARTSRPTLSPAY